MDWMRINSLRFNPKETEMLLVGSNCARYSKRFALFLKATKIVVRGGGGVLLGCGTTGMEIASHGCSFDGLKYFQKENLQSYLGGYSLFLDFLPSWPCLIQ